MNLKAYLQELADSARPLAISRLTSLSSLDADETSHLVDAWPELELTRRQRVIQELIDLAEDNVELDFDRVFFVALGDSDAEVRRNAVRGLWEHESRDLIDPLADLLETDTDPAVRAEAALGLGRFVLQAEFGVLHRADAERVESALRRAAEDTAEVVEVRGRALESIGASSRPWVRDLIEEAFDSDDRRRRISAVHAMGRSCNADWLPTLVRELENEDPEIRYEAVCACGSIADEAAMSHLLPLLYDEDVEVQEAAIGALGEIGGSLAKEALKEMLEGPDERVREAALAALAEIDFDEDPLGVRMRR